VSVLLGGWRRQYIINRLTSFGVPFKYIESTSDDVVNTMYQSLDLYVVSARCEGGPQALIECGLAQVPCVSTPVGISEQVLDKTSIDECLQMASPGIPRVEHMKMINVIPEYLTFFRSL
jgi:hypothetical protein